MNLVQMTQLMDKFESQFEDLDVQISVMDQAMSSTSVQSTPESEVNSLMQEVADEHGACVLITKENRQSGALQRAALVFSVFVATFIVHAAHPAAYHTAHRLPRVSVLWCGLCLASLSHRCPFSPRVSLVCVYVVAFLPALPSCHPC